MFLQGILEVVIGLIFVWLVLSIATMSIQEWINKLFKKRAKDLEIAIGKMLADPELTAQFYNHPAIIGALKQKTVKTDKGKTKIIETKKPEWIPSPLFTQVLFNIVATAGTEASLLQGGLSKIRKELLEAKGMDKSQAILEMDAWLDLARRAAATDVGKKFRNIAWKELNQKIKDYSIKHPEDATKLDNLLKDVETQTEQIDLACEDLLKKKGKGDAALQDLHRGVIALTVLNPPLHQTLSTLLGDLSLYVKEGENKLALARKNVEDWFNSSMDRVTEMFKRHAQKWSFVIGLVLALALNVDTIALATQLWREPTVRQALVAVSEQFVAENPEGVEIPEGGVDPKTAVQNFEENFSGLNIPLGWSFEKITGAPCKLFPTENEQFGFVRKGNCYRPVGAAEKTNLAYWVLAKLVGILMSAVATLQGAPFWFDLLRTLVSVRGSGIKSEEKKETLTTPAAK